MATRDRFGEAEGLGRGIHFTNLQFDARVSCDDRLHNLNQPLVNQVLPRLGHCLCFENGMGARIVLNVLVFSSVASTKRFEAPSDLARSSCRREWQAEQIFASFHRTPYSSANTRQWHRHASKSILLQRQGYLVNSQAVGLKGVDFSVGWVADGHAAEKAVLARHIELVAHHVVPNADRTLSASA